MRNTTMQDALMSILTSESNTSLESQTDEAVLSAVGATRRKLTKESKKTKHTAAITRRIQPAEIRRPRGFTKISPFSVSASPEITIPKAVVERESERKIPKVESPVPAAVLETKKPDVLETSLPGGAVSPLISPLQSLNSEPKPENLPEPQTENLKILPNESSAGHEPFSEVAGQPASLAEEIETPAIILPSDLTWLEKPTPFSSNLSVIVGQLRDARQRVIFTLEQCQARQKEYRKQLDAAEYGIEEQKENLRKLDDTISACSLVAEQSASLKPDLLATDTVHHHKHIEKRAITPGSRRSWNPNDPTMCHQRDVVNFFKANPNTNWTAVEIIKSLPAAKQAHAKKHVNIILSALNKLGTVRRMGTGIYRMDTRQGSEDRDQGPEDGELKQLGGKLGVGEQDKGEPDGKGK